MVNFMFEMDVNDIEIVKPDIPGNFVSTMTPDIFLLIKCRLIRRKIFQLDLSMALKEKSDLFSFVPFSSIYKEIDEITTKLFQHMLQHLYKSLFITFGSTYQTFPPQQWSHPARQIQPLAVLAGGRDFESLTDLSPAASQTGMQAKTGLILENNGLILFKMEQFFLTPGENSGHPYHELEDKRSQLFSGCNPGNATSIGLVSLSTLSQTLSSGGLPEWVHPSQLSRDQIPEGFFPSLVSVVSLRLTSAESAVLADVEVSEMRLLPGLIRESNLPGSFDLAQTKYLSVPDAGPPKPAIRQQFSIQSMPLEFALPWLIIFLGLHQIALYLKLSWLKHNIYFVNVQIFSALVLDPNT
jgi:hypothetical protein